MRAVIGCVVLLLGCGRQADDRICSTAPSDVVPGDMVACAHKWAYRLARSDEPAVVVAKAVARACRDVAEYTADQAAKSPAVLAAGDPDEVRAQTYAGNLALGETEALFRVIQARSGNCDIP